MNFYHAQDQAKKQTYILILLFSLSVLTLIVITNFCVAVFILYSNPEYSVNSQAQTFYAHGSLLDWMKNLVLALGWEKFTWVSLLVFGVVFIAMGFKWTSLRAGGRVVAESLGGRAVTTNTDNLNERRLLNVVEEIALASGIPAPQVFLLDNEPGINAFAAGLSLEDAVIGVTRGALESFNRDQLQGVIAHEFSHILNGDMRLNMKLLAVLHGILMIGEAGRLFMSMTSHHGHNRSYRRSYRQKTGLSMGLFVFGLVLWLIGLLGQFFGALIKSAVSRQREFLADASAVQFTRNPSGIGEALSIIGGSAHQSQVNHHGAHELGHLFFSKSSAFNLSWFKKASLFSTHPPLELRIKRVLPRWRGRFIKSSPEAKSSERVQAQAASGGDVGGGAEVSLGQFASNTVSTSLLAETDLTAVEQAVAVGENSHKDAFELVEKQLTEKEVSNQAIDFFEKLKSKVREPFDAQTIVMALLLDESEAIRARQLSLIADMSTDFSSAVNKDYPMVACLTPIQRLHVIEISVPTLKILSLQQYKVVREVVTKLIHADGKVDLFEWLLFQLLKQYCDRHFGLSKPIKAKYKNIKQISPYYEVVLSRVVHYGNEDEHERQEAFNRGCNASGAYTLKLLPFNECNQARFTRAISELAHCYPLLKPRLLKGLIKAAQSDECVSQQELYVIKGIAVVMDCPLIGLEID